MSLEEQERTIVSSLTPEEKGRYTFLKKRRGFYKGRLTFYTNQLDTDSSIDQGVLESMLKMLRTYQKRFDEAQDELESEFPDIEALFKNRENFSNEFMRVFSRVRQMILDKTSSRRLESPMAAGQSTPVRPKLPDINIPKFDGDRKKWMNFSNVFKRVIADRADVDDITKFRYLETSTMDGRAASIVASVTDSNFETAWSRLSEFYSDQEQLKQSLIQELYDVKLPKNPNSKAFEDFANHIECTLGFFNSIQVDTFSWDLLLVYYLTRKLDVETRKELEKERKTTVNITLKAFLNFVRDRSRYLQALAECENTFSKSQVTSTPKVPEKQNTGARKKEYSGSFVAASSDMNCPICNEAHKVLGCDKIKEMKPELLLDAVKKAYLCFNCLRRGHRVRDCTSSLCRVCNEKHHTLLHDALTISKELETD